MCRLKMGKKKKRKKHLVEFDGRLWEIVSPKDFSGWDNVSHVVLKEVKRK